MAVKSPKTVSRVTDGGRIVLPAKFRRQLGLQVGSNVVLQLAGKKILLTSAADAMRDAQSHILKTIRNPKKSMAQELIADRRKEVADDEV